MPNVAKVDRLHVYAGSRLREQREKKGLSQEALAALVAVSRQTVAEWEAGRYTPGGAAIARLASVLGCEPNDFYLTRDLTGD